MTDATNARWRLRRNPTLVVPPLLILLSFLGVLLPSCRDGGPTAPDPSDLEIVIVQGDAQAAEPGALLPLPLTVRIQDVNTGRGMERLRVRWQVLGGSGARVEPLSDFTDSEGMASAHLTLGSALGTYLVRASVAGVKSSPADFQAQAILVPELSVVPSSPVHVGDTILLKGNSFSSNREQNVVTFSRIRGQVISASSTELRVEVPSCLPNMEVAVRVQIGTLSTPGLPLRVEGQEGGLFLSLGEDLVLDVADGLTCLHLPSVPGTVYLVVPHSTSTLGGGVHQFSLVGLTADGRLPSAAAWEGTGPDLIHRHPPGSDLGAQELWKRRLRVLEDRLIAGEDPLPPPPVHQHVPHVGVPARAPAVGDIREFNVLTRDHTFDRITAQLRHISHRLLVFVDEDSPPAGFTDSDLVDLATEFDDFAYPTVTRAFGQESDVDGNGRVVLLLTPGVNRLTAPEYEGFVGGFFFGLDLLKGRTGSNEAEIIYGLVPDPTGREGPVLSRALVMETLPPVLAHEFQHMIHFNQRILVGGASSQEALWLSEALAQMAEDLVGMAFAQAGRSHRAYLYQVGNWGRARRFLLNPSQVSVLASLPPGTLAERGAGWLLLKQLSGQGGQEKLLERVTASTLTGVANLTTAVGRSWESLMADWTGALYLDGTGIPVRPHLQVPGVNLRAALSGFDGSYPLSPRVFGPSSFLHNGSLWSSAPDFFITTPPADSGGLALSVAGPEGRPPEPAMKLQLLVVRLR